MTALDAALAITLEASVLLFSVGSMFAVGLAAPLGQILEPLRRFRSVLVPLLANFVIVPALGFGIVHALSLERSVALGLLLVATAPGSPFLVQLTTSAQGDVSLSATLLLLLLPGAILYVPLILPFLVPEATVSAWAIARPLLLTMLLPLALGILVHGVAGARTAPLLPWLRRLMTFALLLLVVSSLASSYGGVPQVGVEGLVAAALLVAAAFATGYALSTRGPEGRVVLGLGTAQRNIAAATVVSTQTLHDPTTTLMVIVTSLVGLGILLPATWWLRGRTERGKGKWQSRIGRTS